MRFWHWYELWNDLAFVELKVVGRSNWVTISVTPLSLNFGDVILLDTTIDSVTVANTGTGTLNVGPININGPDSANFSVDPSSLPLKSGESKPLVVSFTPDIARSFSASLQVNSDGGNVTVSLTGNGASTSRLGRVVDSGGSPGSKIDVPIVLESQGDENALGFSLEFDTTVLDYDTTSRGQDASNAILNVNEFQRADCAPRPCGDRRISVADWVQACRYAAALDPVVPACGPTSPTTTIEFSLPHSGHVTLKIFDLLGREVAVLVNAPFAAGNYKVDWDAGGLESGMYFYSIQVGGWIMKKFIALI